MCVFFLVFLPAVLRDPRAAFLPAAAFLTRPLFAGFGIVFLGGFREGGCDERSRLSVSRSMPNTSEISMAASRLDLPLDVAAETASTSRSNNCFRKQGGGRSSDRTNKLRGSLYSRWSSITSVSGAAGPASCPKGLGLPLGVTARRPPERSAWHREAMTRRRRPASAALRLDHPHAKRACGH